MATTSAGIAPDELGAAAFLTKPVDFDQLKQQLVQLMRPLG